MALDNKKKRDEPIFIEMITRRNNHDIMRNLYVTFLEWNCGIAINIFFLSLALFVSLSLSSAQSVSRQSLSLNVQCLLIICITKFYSVKQLTYVEIRKLKDGRRSDEQTTHEDTHKFKQRIVMTTD